MKGWEERRAKFFGIARTKLYLVGVGNRGEREQEVSLYVGENKGTGEERGKRTG